jgi:hypothetical protein
VIPRPPPNTSAGSYDLDGTITQGGNKQTLSGTIENARTFVEEMIVNRGPAQLK